MKNSWIAALMVALGLLLIWSPSVLDGAQFIVTRTADSGEGSLHQELMDAANHSGHDSLYFHIPLTDTGYSPAEGTWTIRLLSPLPAITGNSLFIDGTSQASFTGNDTNPAGPEIVIDGSGASESEGLVIQASGSEIRHLAIHGFAYNQIKISCDDCRVTGCYIGTDATGMIRSGKGRGISIFGNRNRIGGYSAAERNVISGLRTFGVEVSEGRENRLIGNAIGINAAGSDTLGNAWGVRFMDESRRNTLGPGNVISGNRQEGVWINQSDSNRVIGNRIGTDPEGNLGWGNYSGVLIVSQSSCNTVGGAADSLMNIISSNQNEGILIYLEGSDSNTVIGNRIGTNAAGTLALPNGWTGISISSGASRNQIGGENPEEGNLISGNKNAGIKIFETTSVENIIAGNQIGTNADGTGALSNEQYGIILISATGNRIGPGNHIAYNEMDGILIQNTGTDRNRITRNSIHDNLGSGIVLNGGNSGIEAPAVEGLSPVRGSASPGASLELFSGNDEEGLHYLASVTADGSGQFSWSGEVTDPYVTATATDAQGNTSEFSEPFSLTAVENHASKHPHRFFLYPNFPNPFNPETTIRYSVKEPCRVKLRVYDLRGREVSLLIDANYTQGEFEVPFDASMLASGLYFYRIEMGDFSVIRKMVVLD